MYTYVGLCGETFESNDGMCVHRRDSKGGLICKPDKPNVRVCAVYNILCITICVGVFTGPVSSFSDGGPANVFTSLEIGEKRAGGFIRVRGSETCIHTYMDVDGGREPGHCYARNERFIISVVL